MIICICNAIREKELNGVVAQGAASVCEAFAKMGCRPMCGKCVPEVRDVIRSRCSLSVSD